MDVPVCTLSAHLMDRYRQRVYSRATEADVRAVLATAAVTVADPSGRWLYAATPGGWVFALTRRSGAWEATTVMPDDDRTRRHVLRARAAVASVRAGWVPQRI